MSCTEITRGSVSPIRTVKVAWSSGPSDVRSKGMELLLHRTVPEVVDDQYGSWKNIASASAYRTPCRLTLLQALP